MLNLILQFSLPLFILSLSALLVAVYFMMQADRASEQAPFAHQRRAALARAKMARFVIGGLAVIVLELAFLWSAGQFGFQPAFMARSSDAIPFAISEPTPSTLAPTITATFTHTPIPPTATPTLSPTATPSPVPTATPTPAFILYVIQPGDTFSGLAARFGTTVEAIQALNPNVVPTRLRVGQQIRIPAPETAPAGP